MVWNGMATSLLAAVQFPPSINGCLLTLQFPPSINGFNKWLTPALQ